ncbi:MAG: hypothetical protein ACFFDI_24605, partial [Promethearchaeota archaeon]
MMRNTLDAINAQWTDVRNQEEFVIALGDQIREAIEILLESLNETQRNITDLMNYLIIDPHSQQHLSEQNILKSLYQAAIQVIMR